MVDLVEEERVGGKVRESTKRKRVETDDKGMGSPIKVVPLHFKGGDLFQLLSMWSEPDRYGPHSTLCLSDSELKVKALEIAMVVKNASIEGEVHTEVLVKERDALIDKLSSL